MIRITLHIWSQASPTEAGHFDRFQIEGEPQLPLQQALLDESAREKLSALERAQCAVLCNGIPQAPDPEIPLSQTPLEDLVDPGASGGDAWLEPIRARALPVLKDLAVDRSALLRLQQKARSDGAPESACIACGACIAACPNASARFFCAAQSPGSPEAAQALAQMAEAEGFGVCEGFAECALVCPKGFSLV